jgi:hypothetical protein
MYVLLFYPDFNHPFNLYSGEPDHQLGAIIMQDKKPIPLFVKAKYDSRVV